LTNFLKLGTIIYVILFYRQSGNFYLININHKYMAKIAVIKTGGKQYKVEEGKTLKIEKLIGEVNDPIKFDTLLISEDNGIELNIGQPSLGDLVDGKILEHNNAKKVSVVKYKNKTRYQKNVGHRQPYSKVEITKIG
jgi:large subunit ribosomal protein L21